MQHATQPADYSQSPSSADPSAAVTAQLHTVLILLCLQDQDRVRLVTLSAVAVFLIVGIINLWQVVDPQQLW